MTRRSPSFPKTPRQLRAWLTQTDVGRAILGGLTDEALEKKCRECRFTAEHPTRPKVLVVVRRLGPVPGVEVFAERGVNVRLEEMLDTRDNAVLEVLAEDELVSRLPVSWRGLVVGQGATLGFSATTGERRLRAVGELEVLRELKALREGENPCSTGQC